MLLISFALSVIVSLTQRHMSGGVELGHRTWVKVQDQGKHIYFGTFGVMCTRWCPPPVISWFILPLILDISTISPSYWGVINQLS